MFLGQKPKSKIVLKSMPPSGFTDEQLKVSVLMLNPEDEDMKITQAAQISDFSAAQISETTTTTSNLLALDSCSGTGLRTSNYIFEAFDV